MFLEEFPSLSQDAVRIVVANDRRTRADMCAIRWEVFVHEQNVAPVLEIDARDFSENVLHLVAYRGNHAIGTVRIIPDGPTHFHLGRLAVRRDARGQGVGAALVRAVHEKVAKITQPDTTTTIELDAQVQARVFYESLGYKATDERVFFDAGIPHVTMVITLDESECS